MKLATLALALTILAACTSTEHPRTGAVGHHCWDVINPGDGGLFVATFKSSNGGQPIQTKFTIASGVEVMFRWSSGTVSVTEGTWKSTETNVTEGLYIRNQLVTVEEQELRIGNASFGSVGAASEVDVKPDGVWVDGVRRGSLDEVGR
jgi:hypothetical protein